MDGQNNHLVDAVIVTDRAGFIRALNAEAAQLLNVAMRVHAPRQLLPFFIEGRLEVIAALRARSAAPLGAGATVVQPVARRPVPVAVHLTQEDDGLQWVLRRLTTSVDG